jgi:hypothetical protein
LALQALVAERAVTQLAQDRQGSRQFVSQQVDKAEQALAAALDTSPRAMTRSCSICR